MNFFSAIATNYRKYVEKSIRNGENINQTDYFGRTPLYYAIAYQSYDMIQLLLSCNQIDLKREDQFGLNVYDYAYYYSKTYPILNDFFYFSEPSDYYDQRWKKASQHIQFVVHNNNNSDDSDNDDIII